MDTVQRHSKKKEMISKVFKDIRKVNQIVFERNEQGHPAIYHIQFIMENGHQLSMTPEEAVAFNRPAVALLSNPKGWPKLYEEWAWTADQSECKLPLDILDKEE